MMSDNWRAWEGRTIDGKFVLGTYLGGSDRSAVFRTRVGSAETTDAAIKLVAAGGAEAESQIRRWKAARQLTHPNLIRILTMGQCAVEGSELVYVVEEAADENLAQIVPERALTAEEVRGMIGPVLDALDYVHGKGMVHERIRPANILALGDQVKLSSDNVGAAGEIPLTTSLYDAPKVRADGISAASEIWSLGITLVEVLAQRVMAWDVARGRAPEIGTDVPEPFRGIAQRCLEVDLGKRCGIREIRERLEGKREAAATWTILPAPAAPNVAAEQGNARPLRWIVAVAVIVALVLAVLWIRSSRTSEGKAGAEGAGASESAQTQPANPAGGSGAAGETHPEEKIVAPESEPGDGSDSAKSGDEIVEGVMPEISASARRTISGKIKVRVRIKVNANGEVEAATLKGAGPSKYFARKALEAAGKWKFARAEHEGENREWMLLFVFSRSKTDVSPARVRR